MSIERKTFGTFKCGKAVESIIMKNKNGMEIEIITMGCRIRRLLTKDRSNTFSDIVLGFDTLEGYCKKVNYQGTVVGPYANRISKGEFEIDGVKYHTPINEGENVLHSGPDGFHNVIWDVESVNDSEEPSATFFYLSKDLEYGFPGNLKTYVTYTLTNDDSLKIEYKAVCDKKTPFNITNHTYFNLNGNIDSTVWNHELYIDADEYTDGYEDLIPNGKTLKVEGTPMDFRVKKLIGKDITSDEATVKRYGGYDHTYVLNGKGFRHIATLSCPDNGREMEVYTDLPSVQLYTDNGTDDTIYKGNVKARAHQAACLETQMFPDSPNRPEFPSTILAPGVEVKTVTVYKFSAK